ncbi:MAG: hypothetical protein JSR28_17365 [Proteobacteria bacterium]|nr:hypothetical protein [Pseudomonadota bacterium]MDE2411122.1 hypothetical protein [Sphingomonadales bacterium]
MLDELDRLPIEQDSADRPAGGAERASPAQLDTAGTGLPSWIWSAMIAEYAVFFTGLMFAVGRDREAIFMLVISICFAVMFFGTASALFAQKPVERPSAFERGSGDLQTWTGPMSRGAVAAQILVVPGCLAFFGLAMIVIRAFVG